MELASNTTPETARLAPGQLSETDVAMQRLTLERVGVTPVAYVIFAWGLCELTPLGQHGSLPRLLACATTLLTVVRLVLNAKVRRSTSINVVQRLVMRVFTLVTMTCFSVLCGQSLLTLGVSPTSMTALIVLAGVASGGITTLASDLTLTRWFVVSALVPPIVISLSPELPREIPVALVLSLVFYAQVGNRLYQQTLESLQQRQLLQAQSESLSKAKHEAEQASRAKGAFLATMSHELRTPLNGIMGMTELLLSSELDAAQRDRLNTLRGSADALVHIINDILDFSKIEAGKLELESVAFAPARVVKEVAELLRHAPRSGDVSLDWQIEELPQAVIGDAGRLRQMLLNLGSNAIKFTPSGKVTIGARRSERECAAGHCGIRFSVEDTGIGIAEDKLAAIFERFEQADSSTARKYGGTGLGLAITQQLARLMGGQVQVDSALGRGSKFWFDLTFVLSSVEGLSVASDRPQAEESQALKVLVVDDNEVNLKVAVQMLGKLGHRAEVARNGLQAIEAAGSSSFDLIFMDCMMPEMDGLTATRHLRADGYAGPIVAMTANARSEERDECLRAGMNDHVAKPVRMETLRRALQRATGVDCNAPISGEVPPAPNSLPQGQEQLTSGAPPQSSGVQARARG